MKVLIVDDHEPIRRTIKTMLADLVTTFYQCSDGSEALASYVQQQPDWVLMDIEMSQRDGLTATRQITSARPDSRIVIVTNYDDNALRQAAQDAGACAYVLKENLLELRALISGQQLLRRKRSSDHAHEFDLSVGK
jgi:CheY-like chemotaxis protein